MSMTPEAWEFPKSHGVKAIGYSQVDVQGIFISLLNELQLKYEVNSITSKNSRNEKYVSVTINVMFENAKAVTALYGKLHAHNDIVQSL